MTIGYYDILQDRGCDPGGCDPGGCDPVVAEVVANVLERELASGVIDRTPTEQEAVKSAWEQMNEYTAEDEDSYREGYWD